MENSELTVRRSKLKSRFATRFQPITSYRIMYHAQQIPWSIWLLGSRHGESLFCNASTRSFQPPQGHPSRHSLFIDTRSLFKHGLQHGCSDLHQTALIMSPAQKFSCVHCPLCQSVSPPAGSIDHLDTQDPLCSSGTSRHDEKPDYVACTASLAHAPEAWAVGY